MYTVIEQIDEETTVHHAAQYMGAKQIGVLLVMHDTKVSGIVTERHLIQKTLANDQDPLHIQVGAVMT